MADFKEGAYVLQAQELEERREHHQRCRACEHAGDKRSKLCFQVLPWTSTLPPGSLATSGPWLTPAFMTTCPQGSSTFPLQRSGLGPNMLALSHKDRAQMRLWAHIHHLPQHRPTR